MLYGYHTVTVWQPHNNYFSLKRPQEESPYMDGKITHTIVMVPTANLTVSCTVSNDLGQDMKVINVSSCK